MRVLLGLGLTIALLPSAASAADPAHPYNVEIQSFDMWCQETQHYDPDRCDARAAADVDEYDHWRATIERYQIPYLKRVEQEENLQSSIIQRDVEPRGHNGAATTQ